ncbi:MAG: serine/threonine protein kinase [Reinekea sp.]|jgi:Ser/Thr protein kinase RdoA (MazF antagonist)
MSPTPPYQTLTQDRIIDWLESLDIESDYRIYPLNSYENRVYRIGIEDSTPIVMKIYRPDRWNEAQVREELIFTQELYDQEIPVVPALSIQGDIVHERDGFLLTCFPMRAGHAFELDDPDKLYRIGQLLGRMHSVGKVNAFQHRKRLSLASAATDSLAFFDNSPLLPDDMRANYLDALNHLAKLLQPFEEQLNQADCFRIHGDFHAGNILSRDDALLLVDFDDCVTGPAMQDIWKLLSGSDAEQTLQLSELKEGYEQFADFPRTEISLIDALRTAHMIRHTLWIAKRWHDPAFPQAFTWFGSARYWSEQLLGLREQWAVLQEK